MIMTRHTHERLSSTLLISLSLLIIFGLTPNSLAQSSPSPDETAKASDNSSSNANSQANGAPAGSLSSMTADKLVGPPATEAIGPPPPPPQVNMSCDPNPTPVAAPVTCVVMITHPQSMTVQVTAPPGAESGVASLPKANEQGLFVTKRLFTIRQIELNKPLRVKDVQVRWSALGNHEGVVKLPPQKIPVKMMLMGVSDPKARDFAHPTGQRLESDAPPEAVINAREAFWQRHQPPSLTELNWTLIIILGALIVSALGIFLGWLIRLWAEVRARRNTPFVDPRPAHIIAFESLDDLERARLIEEGAFKIYSHRLSEILRAYFGKRYDFNGLEMTSDELREAMISLKLNDEAYLVLEDFLSDTDLIKFADMMTSAQAIEESKHRVYRLIDLTKVEDEQPDDQGQASSAEEVK